MTDRELAACPLLPCPWCGGEAVTERGKGNVGHYVTCRKANCGIGPDDPDKGAAENAWNNRPGDYTAAIALVTRMRFACGDNGKRMQDELEQYLRGLLRDAERWRYIAADHSTAWADEIDAAMAEERGNV